ncbi:hypothetical protein RF11_13980 [Thelohanellus kitauei]|uniref:Uncharacterized protein n=1 Tax=Thelohanellus kitauei TaxID=669202 RepID=A0A0C2MH74_THEKT|nr:hypothetical protein RF11_13980 [Thelohanellus kitauei]
MHEIYKNCPGICKTNNEQIIVTVNHSHGHDVTLINSRLVLNKREQMANEYPLISNQQILTNSTANDSTPVVAALPSFENLTLTIPKGSISTDKSNAIARSVETTFNSETLQFYKHKGKIFTRGRQD